MRPTLLSLLSTLAILLALLVGCQKEPVGEHGRSTASARPGNTTETTETTEATETKDAAPQIGFGNGDANWIIVEGVTRAGDTLTFREVHIDGNGWLVLHPFENGKPVGDRYVGSTYLTSGDNAAVAIQIDSEPETGDRFLVMLHRDVNENREFDFVFVDARNVLDKAVFEGTTMIAHPIAVP